jgi:MFS family permease
MTDAAKTWRTPTVVILAGCLITIVGFGTRAGFGLWLDPMSKSLGWGREVFSLAVAIQVLVWGAAQPFAGLLADKYGNARVLSIGALCYAGAVYLMANSATPAMLNLSGGLLLGLGLAGASFSIVLAAFGRMVPEERRSTAFGIGTAAGSMGQFLIVPISQFLISRFDWQLALIIASSFPLLIIPLSIALAGRAEHDGVGAEQSVRGAIREASRHRSYILLVLGFFVCGFHVTFIQVHLPPYITDAGMDAYVGAWAIATIGLFNIIGSLTSGILGDKFSKKYLLSGLYLTRSLTIAIYVMMPPTIVSTLVFAGVMGLLWLSTVPLTSGLVAQMFGPRYMGMLFGFVFFSHQVGSFLGVWLGGKLYDTTGSYAVVWWMGVALGVAAALVHFPINEGRVARLAQAS